MADRHHNIATPFRVIAAVMLWLWCASQAVCVAHCHGLMDQWVSADRQAQDGQPTARRTPHGCCSHRRSSPSDSKTASSTQPSTMVRTASNAQPAPSHSTGSSGAPASPCAHQAVIAVGLNLDAPTLSPVALPFPQDSTTKAGTLGPVSGLPLVIDAETRWSDPSLPRCDAGFEPSVILGSGLRSLAPPPQG